METTTKTPGPMQYYPINEAGAAARGPRADESRLQILFDSKSDNDTRLTLKSHGSRWSPRAGAWQRQLNDNAIRAADGIKCILLISGERPSEVQRKARGGGV